jgi:predicted ATPase
MYLREIQFLWDRLSDKQKHIYPANLPAYQGLERLRLDKPVTFFVGENGTGKSTLLEAIASLCGFPTSGGEPGGDELGEWERFPLADVLRLSWFPKMNRGFFLRSETYHNFGGLLERRLRDPDFDADPYERYGGRSLFEQSHGESFIKMFQSRLKEKGIYLLDEPEAALSPTRQLGFLRLLHAMAESGRAQFLICTHSPILLGYPGAEIFSFDGAPVSPVSYEETEHYAVTRYFLNNRQKVLDELFQGEDE